MPYKDPRKKREAQRRRREVKRGTVPPPGEVRTEAPPTPPASPPTVAPPIPLRTAGDALAVLEQAVNEARADVLAGPQTRARTLAYLIAVGLKVFEAGSLEERVAALEQKNKGKKQP